ncbi:MAG: hypothetical protein V3R65_04040 [Acidiferrobacterales bacterium]
MAAHDPLTHAEIQQQLDVTLDVEFSFINTEDVAEVLAGIAREDQDFIISWVQKIAATNIQLSHQFIMGAIDALDKLEPQVIESWALHAMDIYDVRGMHPAMEVIRNVDEFIQTAHERAAGALFEDEAGVLLHFAHGLSGRQLKIEESDTAYTDSETLFLPTIMARLQSSKENFLIYKIMVAYLWAQTRFGTFRLNLQSMCDEQTHSQKFLLLFHALETVRLEACIKRELPGLYRELVRIRSELGEPALDNKWHTIRTTLEQPDTSAIDVVALTGEYVGKIDIPAPAFYQGELRFDSVIECKTARIEKEKASFRYSLRQILEEISREDEAEPDSETPFDTKHIPDPTVPEGFTIELTLDDKPIQPPDHVRDTMTSIILDLGDIPDEYLVPAGPGEYDPALFQDREANPDDVWQGTYHEEGAFLYDEWDCRRQHYRKHWCAVREKTITPVYDDFVNNTLHKYSGLIKHLRKTFEAMRDEDRVLNRQPWGDDIDIDALVQAIAEARDGSEMSDSVFTRRHRTERNIAVIFMVDMSGSTKGWINDAERESLILMAEALESLDDRYAIYGFSGMARKRCEIYKIKGFDEKYDDEIKARISGIKPQDYTRMGFAIRHLTHLLQEVDARTRVLITISDGKPDDYDNYRGQYGIEDTRRALIEAHRVGIHSYCITIDKEAKDYLPYMYGDAAYTVIDDISRLPLKVSDIYRHLTT